MVSVSENALGTGERGGSTTSKGKQSPDSPVLKSIRYEEATAGTPPAIVEPVIATTTVAAAGARQQKPPMSPSLMAADAAAPIRPTTAPAPRSVRSSHFSEDVKRDSGFASSPLSQHFSTSSQQPPTPRLTKHDSNTNGQPLSPFSTTSKDTPLSPISSAPSTDERRPRTAFSRRKSTKNKQKPARSVSPPSFKRLSSFKGLQTEIPTGDLGDLGEDNFGFSHRGSVFFGGQKMNELFGSANGSAGRQVNRPAPPLIVEPTTAAAETTPALNGKSREESMPEEGLAQMRISSSEPASPTKEGARGLVAGRRKPSIQMLQAAIERGRVLSAEEITFSMKVRSMYEAGDENGVDWSVPAVQPRNETPETMQTQTAKDETELDEVADLEIKKNRHKNASSRRSQDIRASYYTKQGHELAGGIEDWSDVNGGDVDRYGFIVPRREDRPSSVTGSAPADGLHRVATGLRLAADQPRRTRLRRTPSASRSSRSVPPRGSMRPSSLHSGVSAMSSASRSRRNGFRSKDRKITAIAGDMLTLPPGLADISEDQDDGQVLSAMKKKEWSRNEKWQRMARAITDRSQGTGGGMRFDFDVNDPKVISRTWKGIPDRWRATAWHSFLSYSAKRRGNYASDEELIKEFHRLQDVNCADDYQIDVDVPRTISMHIMFRKRYRGGQRLLFRVLHAISLYSPHAGYVQGMASLAATLLCYFDEERAFVMMVRLWQLRGLEQLFSPGFEGLMTALKELEEQWLAGSDVSQKLNELNISSTSYGTRWYLTLFNMSIPFPAQLRVWDVFMLLGDATPIGKGSFGGADLDVLHATSAALIDATREIILDSDFENAMKVLTSFVPIRDEDLLMRVARAEWKMGKKRNVGGNTAAATKQA